MMVARSLAHAPINQAKARQRENTFAATRGLKSSRPRTVQLSGLGGEGVGSGSFGSCGTAAQDRKRSRRPVGPDDFQKRGDQKMQYEAQFHLPGPASAFRPTRTSAATPRSGSVLPISARTPPIRSKLVEQERRALPQTAARIGCQKCGGSQGHKHLHPSRGGRLRGQARSRGPAGAGCRSANPAVTRQHQAYCDQINGRQRRDER